MPLEMEELLHLLHKPRLRFKRIIPVHIRVQEFPHHGAHLLVAGLWPHDVRQLAHWRCRATGADAMFQSRGGRLAAVELTAAAFRVRCAPPGPLAAITFPLPLTGVTVKVGGFR